MKKKTVIIIALNIAMLVILVVGAYTVFDNIFPKATPITQLQMNMVESVRFYDNENKDIVIDDEALQKLINYINAAVPTRTMSVNDYPVVSPYYVVEFKTTERFMRYMIYEDNGTAYVEIPYEGVYKIDEEVVSILK